MEFHTHTHLITSRIVHVLGKFSENSAKDSHMDAELILHNMA